MNAIETIGLTKRFKGRIAVENLNLSIGQGEFFALLGQNGAGKTTTIRMLTGLLAPSAGDALLMGESIVRSAEAAKAHSNLSPQETAVAQNLSVRENLMLIAGYMARPKLKQRSGPMQPCGSSGLQSGPATGQRRSPAHAAAAFHRNGAPNGTKCAVPG